MNILSNDFVIILPDWAYTSYANNTLVEYGMAILIFLITLIILYLFVNVILGRLKVLSAKTAISFDDAIIDMIEGYGWPLYVFISSYIGIQFIEVGSQITNLYRSLTIIILVYYVIRSLQSLIHYGFCSVVKKRVVTDKYFDPAILNPFETVINIICWTIGLLLILQNLGFNITALLGGLGIGGIALAFSLQNVLSDLFASISIFFDRPFKSGDFIIVGNDMGVVKKIGIKSTRIESLNGQEIIIPNKELADARVNNYKHMQSRRVVFNLTLSYQTSIKKLKALKISITEIIDAMERTRLDRVHFLKFGDSALVFEVAYYILSSDYNVYMDIQEQINFAIKESVEKKGIEMAYPTQTIYIGNKDAM